MALFTSLASGQTVRKINRDSLMKLNRVVDHIHHNFTKKICLEKMAEISCLSPYHFHRQFAEAMGETPSGFIRRVRLERAAHKLMLERYKPITRIALECGFSSSQNFARDFKAQFNVTPSQLRKSFNWYAAITAIQQIKNGTLKDGSKELAMLENFFGNRNIDPADILKGAPPSKVEIKTLPPTRVAYIRTVGAAYSHEAVKPAFEQLLQWAWLRNLVTVKTRFRGVAWNNTDMTPANKLMYDVCIEISNGVKSDPWVSVQTLPGGEFAVYHSIAPVHKHVDQSEFIRLCHWMLFSDYRPEGPPYHNIYQNRPESHPRGLAMVDLCIPVKPLGN